MFGIRLHVPSDQRSTDSTLPAARSGPVTGRSRCRGRPRVPALLLVLLALCGVGDLFAEVTLTQVGHWGSGPYWAVAVDGHYAYVTSRTTGLDIIDLSSPAAPVLVGNIDTDGYAYGVAVAGDYAYVADGNAGLQVIDIRNPAAPLRVGGFDTDGYAYSVAVAGDYAYFADGSAGLQVIDIRNPAAPLRVGGFDTAGSARSVAVAGDYAYVADSDAGLQVIDIRNPAAPLWVGGVDTDGYANSVAVAGDYAYVADDLAGLQVIDIRNPAAPLRVGGFDTEGDALSVAVAGDYVYVADYDRLVILRIQDTDSDRDGIPDATDNCPQLGNADQANFDRDPLGDACDPDDDNDRVPDTTDCAPLDQTNKGALIALPLNSIQSAAHGFGWGDNAYRSRLAATFISDGGDRLLHVAGYDVDSAIELSLWLNDRLLGYLPPTANAARGTDGLWWLPAAAQISGENRLEIRQRSAGDPWGVTGLGLFSPGAAFGNLKTLSGGDRSHGAGFELHLPQSNAGYLLGLSGYDSDRDGELALLLNGTALVSLPKGTNAAWTPDYQLVLPASRLGAGANRLLIRNSGLATEDWGVRLSGLRGFSADQGLLESLPAAQQADDRVSLLLAPGTTASVLSYRCFDIDNVGEVALTLDTKAAGTCPLTGDQTWGTEQRVILGAQARHLLVFDNTLNPPGTDPWGLRLTSLLGDRDADGVPDGSDNCPTTANPDQANLDADGLGDVCDADLDGDGVPNGQDAFPRDTAEWVDTDLDRVGNNADVDDDNDGFPDWVDPAPLDARRVPPALIGVYSPATQTFLLDLDGSRSETADDWLDGPYGQTGDLPVRGDWNGDGLDDLGAYRPSDGRFYLDLDGWGLWSASDPFGTAADLPVSGDWDGDGAAEIGLYHPAARTFTLDLDGSLSPTAADVTTAPFGALGDQPVTGDWNGDRRDEIGVWRPGTRVFYLDANGSRDWNTGDRTTQPYGLPGDQPLAGDWNGDGPDEIGVYRPSTQRFYLDLDASSSVTSGDAISAPFGAAGDLPLPGRW